MTTTGTELGHWALFHYARPMSLNDYRSKHWRKHQDHEQEWRQAGAILALEAKLPKGLARVRFEAWGFGPGSQQDPGNCYPSVKAMIDGLVDVGVIADDDGEHVESILLLPWQAKGRQSGLELHIYEVPTDE